MKEETHSLKCIYKGVQPYIKVTAYELSAVNCSADKMSGYYGEEGVLISDDPQPGYNFSNWSVTGTTLTGNNFKFNGDVTAKANYSAIKYNVTLQNDGHGSIGANKTTGNIGDTITLSNTANSHYGFSGYSITGANLTGNAFNIGTSNVTAKAWFSALPSYTLTLQNDGHGTLTANKVTGYAGDTVTLSPSYNTYYRFNNYSVTGGSVNGNTFTFGNGNATAKANFKVNNVTITGVWETDSYYGRPTYNSTYNSWENGTVYPIVKGVTGGYIGSIGSEFQRSYMSSWGMQAQPIVYVTGTQGKDKYVSAYFDNSNAYAYSEKTVYVHATDRIVGTTTGTRKLGCSGGGTGSNGMTNPRIKFEVGEPTTTTMPTYSFGGGWTATGIAQ